QGLAVLLSSPLRGIPVVRDFYGPWHDEYRVKSCGHMAGVSPPARVRIGMALRKWADTHVLRHVDHVRVLSDYTADVIRTICPGHAPITTIPAGINLAHFSRGNHDDARYSLNLPLDRPLIFTVRNLTPRMGLDVLIEATARVKEHLPNVLTVIGGDGFLRAELERQAARAGLDGHVRFAGRIAEELLPTFYRAADVFVLPTQALEGFGLVTLEAMACGTPVLATPNGGTLEILGPYGHTFLLEQADVTAMAGRLTELLTDPDKRRAMGAQARMIAEKRFDANVCAKVFGDFLARVAGRTKKESDT
ncbi:MAG: glycosyltransferase family 1 protein, partial [Spartobacteria bacterium]|nr:glycosyltransferase family 1 protein [Spartobacteria bacterium]